MSIIIL